MVHYLVVYTMKPKCRSNNVILNCNIRTCDIEMYLEIILLLIRVFFILSYTVPCEYVRMYGSNSSLMQLQLACVISIQSVRFHYYTCFN